MAGDKIENTKIAAREVLRQLEEGDRFALVTYETYARVLLPSTLVSAESREQALAAIDAIHADGTTNLAGGVERAKWALLSDASAAHSVRRMVLLSDGQANVGETRNEALFAIAGDLRNKGIGLSSIGVGADFNAQLMEGLAENGGGRFRFLENPTEMAAAFTKELQLAARLVASDVRVVLHPAEGATIEDVYGNVYDRVGRDVVVHLPDLASTTQLRVLARLRVDASTPTVPVIDTLVTYADVSSDRARVVTRTPQLMVNTTSSVDEVARMANREVLTFAITGKGIADARRAIELYDQGRREEALASLDRANSIVSSANTNLKSKELGESIFLFGNLRSLFATSANALGGDEASVNVRVAQRKAIRNFGSNNMGAE
jgi:Ca-activated chloride channel family protein